MNQREAVYSAVVAVIGEVSGKVELTKEQKDEVHSLLLEQFSSGGVEIKGSRTPEYFKKYIPGLVNNWLRKDTRLNGGEKYAAKNPGSRTGSGDEQMKAMRALLSATTDASARAEIEAAIATRKEQLKPRVEINAAALPESLRRFVPA